MLRGKAKLDIIEVVISKALINSHISYDKVVSVNRMQWDERRNQKSWKWCGIYYMKKKQRKPTVLVVRKILETKIHLSAEINKID